MTLAIRIGVNIPDLANFKFLGIAAHETADVSAMDGTVTGIAGMLATTDTADPGGTRLTYLVDGAGNYIADENGNLFITDPGTPLIVGTVA